MRKFLNIVLVVLCVNWLVIGVYSIQQMDESFFENIWVTVKPFIHVNKESEKTDKDALLKDEGGLINDDQSTVVNKTEVEDDTDTVEQTESIIDGMDEVCDMIDVDCQFKVMTLNERYGEALNESVKINPSVITYEELRFVQVPHIGYDGQVHLGEMIVNAAVVEDVVGIFKDLFLAKYPIEKMRTINNYNGSDADSMADNNSSAFNYREMAGGGKLSRHAYGLAIDLNPIMNPYVKKDVVLPASGIAYVNRELSAIGMIKKGDPVYEAFVSRGWTWGGDWNSLKDYQHFEKPLK